MEGLANLIQKEKKYVYVDPDGYKLLNEANNPAQINYQTHHRYIHRDQHLSRVNQEKAVERARRVRIT